jgi:ubiquinone/menaquinone biosynthesis C-methylase UbiE
MLAIAPGDVIADIGAGTGYFSIPMAGFVPRGKVFAVDAQQGMLDLLSAKTSGLQNIEKVCARAEFTQLESGSCDLAFYANIWHELDDRGKVLLEALRILKPQGRIAILDWRKDVEWTSGPPLEHRLSPQETIVELAARGFTHCASRDAGRYSWLVQATIYR